MLFLWLKLLHIVAMTSWMAGIFYLPRIFVHYVEGLSLKQDCSRLVIMASKLFSFMTLMALITLALGLILWLGFGFTGKWMYAKLFFVVLLIAYHYCSFRLLLLTKAQQLTMTSRQLRLFNEVPLLVFIPILYFVLMKPF